MVMIKPPAPAGGDGIGLSITVSPDDHEYDTQKQVGDDKQAKKSPSYIPPISFREEEDGGDGGNIRHTVIATDEPSILSSIMRGRGAKQNEEESSSPPSADGNRQQRSDCNTHVTALEDRVRDLEEKLSTLSMLLLQQNLRQSPRHNSDRKSYSSSPDSSGRDSSISPPTTPFRSLDPYATIPSSNDPVLESPTPLSSRYGSYNNSDSFSPCPLPYEQRSNRYRNSNRSPAKISQGLRNNLSFQILHAPDGELDLRRTRDDSSRSDAESEHSNVRNMNNSSSSSSNNNEKSPNMLRSAIRHDEDFEKAMRVPSLDSLPGSSRASPILSQDPVVSRVLSSENLKEAIEKQASPKIDISGVTPGNGIPAATDATSVGNKSSTNATNDGNTPKHQKKKSNIKSKWLDYLNSVQESNYDTDKQMEEFVKVPNAVEALVTFGFWISVDSFLYTLTMLPLRFAYSIFLLAVWVYTKITRRCVSESVRFHRHNSYHVIQVSIIYIIYAYVLKPIDISIMYHWIRVQSMVKLYLIVAIVEVFDRLLCSLGQDCLDSLYWNTTRRPRSSRLIVSALVVLVYTALHSLLLFVHLATLNVAMNSDDQALLSLLIGGNFAEIKSTVFKKYNKATLFKIGASDICERFKLALFLLLVLMLNASQGMDKKMLYNYLSMCGIVWCAEWLSDWLKHSFITKFNYIASGVYSEYSLLLAGDVSGFGHEGENLDNSHAVVKRLGLAQIPLVCVMAKYLKEAYKYKTYEYQPQSWMIFVGTFSIWLLLLLWKLSLASCLLRISKRKLEAAPEFSKNNTTVAKKKN